MRLLISVIAFSFLFNITDAKVYYVSTKGSDYNSGLSASTPWSSLSYAAGNSSPVAPGDIVYVQAGNYGAENVVFEKSGTTANPISFIGYKNKPGDAPPVLVNNSNPYTAFNTSDMPSFNGGDRTKGIGFNCEGRNYLEIKNFQIQDYQYGFVAGSANNSGHLHLYNINVMSIGDVNNSYSGEGFLFGSMSTRFSDYNSLTNCLVVNACAEGFGINGDNNLLSGCKVYCNDNTNAAPTDYYIIITGSYNTVTGCYIERKPGLSHLGHGITIKSNAVQIIDMGESFSPINPEHNKVMYCVAKNIDESFCVRHRGVQYNLFYHCKAIGTRTGSNDPNKGEGNCIVTRDGASNNIFDGCIAENCLGGIVFKDTVEDGDSGTNPPGHPGNKNLYINCLIYNCYKGIDYDSYSIKSDAGNNYIVNCTFYQNLNMIVADRPCTSIKYKDNIFYGCLSISKSGYFNGGAYVGDIIPDGSSSYFDNCDFYNIVGGMPTGFISNSRGSITAAPIFSDATKYDFHLDAKSPCIDAALSFTNVPLDYDSLPRTQGKSADMGAFEYSALTVEIYSNDVNCNGGSNGSATADVIVGTSPYTYVWSNGQTNAVATGLKAGNYWVTVSDADSASQKYAVTITQPAKLLVTNMRIANPSTCSAKDGSITILPTGGTGNYTYNWNTYPIQTTNIISGLPTGQYKCTVSDANDCVCDTMANLSCATDVHPQIQGQDDFLIYPNPTTGIVNIKMIEQKSNEIYVLDIMGKKILEERITAMNSQIDLSGFQNGIYFLKIENDKFKSTTKIILSK